MVRLFLMIAIACVLDHYEVPSPGRWWLGILLTVSICIAIAQDIKELIR